MNHFAPDHVDPYLWYVFGTAEANFSWGKILSGGHFSESQHITVVARPEVEMGLLPVIDLSAENPGLVDPRDADRVTFDIEGPQYILVKDVEYVEGVLDKDTQVNFYNHFGFTTDGSVDELKSDVGNHDMVFTTAIKDSTLGLGSGWDTIDLVDQRDIPGDQYWSLIRRDFNQIDAYSLLTGNRIRMEGGAEARNATPGERNYGEIEQIFMDNSRTGSPEVFVPGSDDMPDPDDQGVTDNIDLRSDGETFSDSFNLAYFNAIRYTSDNVWVGEATIHDGTNYSAPSDRTVTSAKTGYDAPILDGHLSVLGQSRNGTHDLIVGEQDAGQAIDGRLRLYSFKVESGLHNEFNQVYLGTAADEYSDKSGGITGSDWSDRVALYGFGGEDILVGGAGRDYLFGGQSAYNQLIAGQNGNQVSGGTGADYFGVGHTDTDGVVTGATATIGTVSTTGEFHQGYGTDKIFDWHAGQDTMVVLSNGVAVIAGLRNGSGTESLTVANTIDLRSKTAVATSDQDGDGPRGNDGWDANQSLQHIYDNQNDRDAQSIENEDDVTVVNDGLIVARGLDGADVLHGSSGDDYLYGNEGADHLTLTKGGTDRVYFDTFDSSLVASRTASIHVADFDGTGDQVFLNKRVIDAFHSSGSNRSLTEFGGGGAYKQAIAYNPDINFMHDTFYSPSIYDSNQGHRNNDGAGAFGDNSGTDNSSLFSGADGTTFGIGAGMFAAGTVLLFVPFMAGVGAALMATGTVLGAGTAVFPTQEHENATYSGDVGSYLNFITAAETGTTVFSTPATETSQNADQSITFMDFFQNSNAGDGFVEVIEFTQHANEGIYGYFALQAQGAAGTADDETHIFLVASGDNLVEQSETIKVAEINGLLDATDFKIYDGEADIYNAGTEDAVILRDPSVVAVVDQEGDYGVQVLGDGTTPEPTNDKFIDKGTGTAANELEVHVELSGERVAGTTIRVFDGTEEIFNGDENSSTVNAGGQISVTYNSSTNTFTMLDGRPLGTVAFDAKVDPITNERVTPTVLDGVDNNFTLQDSVVNYSIELIDGETGISTRAGTGGITVSGGNILIDGGSEVSETGDILNITGTNEFLNSTSDANLVRIETIMIGAKDTNESGKAGNPAIDDGDDSPVLDLSNQTDGFNIFGSQIADSITGSTGDDTISGLDGNDTINLGTGGSDQIAYAYASNLGVDDRYDIVTGMAGDDEILVRGPGLGDTDGDGNADDPLPGFEDRDGQTGSLLYETSTMGANMRVASATELLVVSNSTVSTAGDLTNNIAAALDSAFRVEELDGNAPSTTTGGGSDSSLLFAVKSATAGQYWVGRYEDKGNNMTVDGNTEIEVFAEVASSDILNSFWQPTELAPQQLSITLPADTGPTDGSPYYTSATTFTVTGLQSGNSIYYNLGSGWNTSTSTTISLNEGSNTISVRQKDGNNYSPETTPGGRTVVVDTQANAPTLTDEGDAEPTDSIVLQWSAAGGTAPIDSYKVEYKEAGDAGYTVAGNVSGSTTSLDIGTLEVGNYTWKVTATDKAGNVGASTTDTFEVVDPNTAPFLTRRGFTTVSPDDQPDPKPYVLNHVSDWPTTWGSVPFIFALSDNEQDVSELTLTVSNLSFERLTGSDPGGDQTFSIIPGQHDLTVYLASNGDFRRGADAQFKFDYVGTDGVGGQVSGTEILYVDFD